MSYIPPEVVEQARQIDLLTYLQNCEPQEQLINFNPRPPWGGRQQKYTNMQCCICT